MNLNRRGYLAVEVILASVVAITISVFLMEITVKLVNTTDDAYVDTELLTDKALIIKNIKSEVEKNISELGGIKSISGLDVNGKKGITLEYCTLINQDYYKNLYIFENKVVYSSGIEDERETKTPIYSKTLNEKYLSNFSITTSKTGTINNNEYILFKIEADSKFSKKSFVANIIVQNNKTC